MKTSCKSLPHSPVPSNAAKYPPGYDRILWAPKKKNKFRPRMFPVATCSLEHENNKAGPNKEEAVVKKDEEEVENRLTSSQEEEEERSSTPTFSLPNNNDKQTPVIPFELKPTRLQF